MLYRVCEAANNEHLNDVMVAQLHERYQSIMVGILAIEQLTGAVQARQVKLGGEARASAHAGTLLGTSKQLEEAQTREAQKKKDEETAQAKIITTNEFLIKAEGAYNAAKAKREAKDKVVEPMRAKCEAVPPAADCNKAQLDKEENELKILKEEEERHSTVLKEKEKELNEAKNEFKQAESNYEMAKEDLVLITKLKGQAQSNATAATKATGDFETTVSYTPISAEVAGQVKDAVLKIVQTIVDKDHRQNSCLVFLTYRQKNVFEKLSLDEQKNKISTTDKTDNQKLLSINSDIEDLKKELEKSKPIEEYCLQVFQSEKRK